MKGRSWNGYCIFKQSLVKWMLVYRRQEQAPEREGRNKGFREYYEIRAVIFCFLCQAGDLLNRRIEVLDYGSRLNGCGS